MEAIIVAIISGFFTLAAIWYQNYLQKKSGSIKNESDISNPTENKINQKGKNPIWRVVFTIVVVVCPLFLLMVVGKDRLSSGDKYLMEYYFIWVVITFVAILLGWKQKSLFEKIILIASLAFLIFMTFEVMYETKRNANYPMDQMQPN
jgi:uncharacterized membrane protein YhaH (DUF805 family)